MSVSGRKVEIKLGQSETLDVLKEQWSEDDIDFSVLEDLEDKSLSTGV